MDIELTGSKCLVAGGAGFLGHRIAGELLDRGAEVRATLFGKPAILDDDRIDYIQADLREPEDCMRAMQGMDYVFMAAANTQGAAVIRSDPLSHVTPNVVMNAHAMEAARNAGVKRYLFISSGAAYPDTGHRPAEEDEMFADEPVDVYYSVAWMKRYGEILCRTYATKIPEPMSCVVVRPSNVYGPGDKYDPDVSHVTAAMVRRVVEREDPFAVWGTGEDIRDLIYIDDFLEGLFAAFHTKDDYLAVNICSGEGVSVRDIIKTAISVDEFDAANITFDPSKPSTVPVRRLSNQFAQDALGFTTSTDLATGLKIAIDDYRNQSQRASR